MKYTIAMCGLFHIESYRDALAPLVFESAMRSRGADVEIVFFAPCDRVVTASATKRTVYPVEQLDAIHAQRPFDAVVIDGGPLLHFGKELVRTLEGDYVPCHAYHAWYTPIEFAVRHRLKVLFNASQVPQAFDRIVRKATATAFRAASYLSVSDEMSRSFIQDVDEDKTLSVTVSPEPLCGVASAVSPDQLRTVREGLQQLSDRYAVLQFDLQRPVSEDEQLATVVARLHAAGMQVLLLPLSSEHNDATALRALNETCGGACITLDRMPDAVQIAAILAGCELFIGADTYGTVTAIAYGRTALCLNYGAHRARNTEVLTRYGVKAFAVDTAAEAAQLADSVLSGARPFAARLADVESAVAAHFDAMHRALLAERPAMQASTMVKPLIELLPTALENDRTLRTLNEAMAASKKATDEQLQELRATVDALRAECDAKEEARAVAANDYDQISKSFFWRLTSPFRRLSQGMKNFVAKRKGLMKAAVYIKGFLRGGPKGAKAKLAAYNGLHANVTLGKLSLEVPKALRRAQESAVFDKDITFSILVPLYNTPMDFLEQMIQSVELQTYGKWELCLADGSDDEHAYVGDYCLDKAKKDPRIKYEKLTENKGISENTNACIEMATGNYIALFDHDDVLDPTVLYEYMVRICEQDADFLYCDEDKFHEFGGDLYDANFKPDFAVDNLRSNNYICHFTVFKASLLEKSGTFRKEFDGSQDHDLVLRLTEHAQSIVHIPKVLYHWRVSTASVASDPYAKPYTIKAGRQAVAEHLERVGLKAQVESTVIHPNIYRIKYEIIGNPLVSIIIPNYNHVEELSRCIDSIMEKSTYRNFEIIIVENNSDAETFAYYETLKKYDNIKVVVYKPTAGFNYSAINNFGVQFASGEHYLLLNNDVEIITPEWIEEMLMYSQREDVGAVGAMLYYPNDTIQHAGVTLGVLTLAGHNFKHSQRGNPGYFGRAGYQQNVTAVTAACLMLPATVYKEVNGLDESFAVAFNDIDFCMRIRQAGHLIVFTPFAELYHYESISRGDDLTPEKRARFVSEVTRFQTRWKKELEAGDPYYNPNLTLDREDFSYKG